MSNMKIMLGNEAIARGAYEAGVKVSAAYPGTPSTEISENIVKYDEIMIIITNNRAPFFLMYRIRCFYFSNDIFFLFLANRYTITILI